MSDEFFNQDGTGNVTDQTSDTGMYSAPESQTYSAPEPDVQSETQSDYSSSFLAEFQRILCRNQNHSLIVVQYDSRKERDVCGKVKKEAPDLLITTNLWGFEQCTLTDNLALNLLNCKQIHLLLHKK